jgi:hypothetical protein
MSHSHASKLLLLLTSSLICLGCDDEPQAPTQTPGVQVSSTSDAPRRSSARPATAAPVTAAPGAAEAATQGATPSRSSAPERTSPAPRTRQAAPETGGAKSSGINQALRDKEVQSPLSLESSLEASQGQWIARWTLRNEGEEPIYLVAQLPVVKGGKVRPDANRIYVRPQGETLHVTKRMWRIPRDVSPYTVELPYLIRLEPGQVHKGAIRLPASIAANFPYRLSPKGSRVLVSEVVLSFGYFSQDAGPRASDTPGLFTLPYGALNEQAFVSSEPHPARLAVR